METLTSPSIETGVASSPGTDRQASGDRPVVLFSPECALVGVIDGLGHGDEAAAAAELAVSVLASAKSESLIWLVRRCHEQLRGTRGVVMSLASISTAGGIMTWMGVGNAGGLLVRADPGSQPRDEWLLLRGGVVGGDLPILIESTAALRPGDTLVFATDGVRAEFGSEVSASVPPQRVADRILDRHGNHRDDALVLVARYLEDSQ